MDVVERFTLMLLLFMAAFLYLYKDFTEYSNNTKVIAPEIKISSPIVKRAMRYHGINYCTFIPYEGYFFNREGRIYNMFDYRFFPKLKPIIRRIKNGKRNND